MPRHGVIAAASQVNLIVLPRSFRFANSTVFSDATTNDPKKTGFIAPTYALPGDRYFVLDKNHRLSALALSGKPFEAELWNVRGPFEKECLLDLNFWLKDKGNESANE